MKRMLMVVTVMTVMASATSGYARKVYLNGVDISSLRDQKFEDVTVTIDKSGNVLITGSRYEVREVDVPAGGDDKAGFSNPRGGPNPALSKRYFLVTIPSSTYRGAYTFDVKINGVRRRVEPTGSKQAIVEISKWLKKGENVIVVAATRDKGAIGGGVRRTSLVIGPGHEENNILKIDHEELRVTADESKADPIERTIRLVAQ